MSGDRAVLEGLLERVRAATGPDRELDGQIALAFGLPQAFFAQFTTDIDGSPWRGFSDVDGPRCFGGQPKWGGGGRGWTAEAYTGSLDAAVALVERVLPGGSWTAAIALHCPEAEGKPYFADAASRSFIEDLDGRGDRAIGQVGGHTPALALCAALLTALLAQTTP